MRVDEVLHLGGRTVRVVGTVAGFVPHAERVANAFTADPPDFVALGVPPEDVEALAALHASPELASEFPEPDEWTARFLELAGRFGPTRIPSPELETAFALATAAGIPVVGVDLDDLEHTEAHTSRLGLRHIVRMNRQRNRLLTAPFDAKDVEELACQWDLQEHASGPLRQIQQERADRMARGIAAQEGDGLAVVPAARWQAVLDALGRLPNA